MLTKQEYTEEEAAHIREAASDLAYDYWYDYVEDEDHDVSGYRTTKPFQSIYLPITEEQYVVRDGELYGFVPYYDPERLLFTPFLVLEENGSICLTKMLYSGLSYSRWENRTWTVMQKTEMNFLESANIIPQKDDPFHCVYICSIYKSWVAYDLLRYDESDLYVTIRDACELSCKISEKLGHSDKLAGALAVCFGLCHIYGGDATWNAIAEYLNIHGTPITVQDMKREYIERLLNYDKHYISPLLRQLLTELFSDELSQTPEIEIAKTCFRYILMKRVTFVTDGDEYYSISRTAESLIQQTESEIRLPEIPQELSEAYDSLPPSPDHSREYIAMIDDIMSKYHEKNIPHDDLTIVSQVILAFGKDIK